MKNVQKIAKEILSAEKKLDQSKFPRLPSGFKVSYDSAFGTGAKAWFIKKKDPKTFVMFYEMNGDIVVTFIKDNKEVKHVWKWKDNLEKLFSDAIKFLKE